MDKVVTDKTVLNESMISLKPEGQRILFIDCLRAFAIFLVTLGHVIEQMGYKDDQLYAFIYSFHMPLFMAISGYVCAYSSYKKASSNLFGLRKLTHFIIQKFRFLLIPYFTWSLLIDPFFFASYQGDINWLSYFRAACIDNTSLFWFLPCLFGLLVSYGLFEFMIWIAKIKNRPWLEFVLIFGLGALLTGLYKLSGIDFLRSVVSYFIPFWLGILMVRFPALGHTIISSNSLLRFCILCFCLVEGIYYGGEGWINKLSRLICGLSAIPICFHLFRHWQLPSQACKQLSYVGQHTLVIYTMQITMLPLIGSLSGLSFILQLIIGSLVSVCWMVVILFLAKLISYDTIMRQMVLGIK